METATLVAISISGLLVSFKESLPIFFDKIESRR